MSSLEEEAQSFPPVTIIDSLEQASDALLALEGVSQDASKEACASLEDVVSAGGSPNVDGVVVEAPIEIAIRPSFWPGLHMPALLRRGYLTD